MAHDPTSYRPQAIDTSSVILSDEILHLREMLARNAHDVWAEQRMADGWKFGSQRDDSHKEHPCLIAYEDLPESEKAYDRLLALETLKAIIAFGYKIEKR